MRTQALSICGHIKRDVKKKVQKKRAHMNNFTAQLNKLENKPKLNRSKKIIKLRK